MSRSGIILQQIMFDPGDVALLSPVVPPPGGSGGSGGGSGGIVAPILAGLLLFFGALGFPVGAVTPSGQPSPAAVTGPGVTPQGPQPAPAPSPPAPAAQGPPAAASPPTTPLVQGPLPSQQIVPLPRGAAPSRPTPVVSSSVPSQGPPGPSVQKLGPPSGSRRRRPVLPFTGANLLTPMAVGIGLIILGLVLRRTATPSSPHTE
jgi:hypothetical protein